MAITKSLVTAGFRGSVGGTLVFRRVNGQTIVSASPERGSKEPSEQQLKQRERFRLATLYSRRVKADPLLLEEYILVCKSKGFQNVGSLIIADYFRSPEIISQKVSTDATTGILALEAIVVDYMRVKSVTVAVKSPDGSVLESGEGSVGLDKQTWKYNFQNATNLVAGVSFEITATDLPGNVTTESFEFEA